MLKDLTVDAAIWKITMKPGNPSKPRSLVSRTALALDLDLRESATRL